MLNSVRALYTTVGIYKRTEHTQMKDRFPATEANTAVAKLRGMSLLSGGLRQWEFYLSFREYTRSHRTRFAGKDLLRKESAESEVRGRETLPEHLRTPACVHIAGKIA